jgi:hypothetical protein
MFAKDDPVTWESHTILREIPVQQGAGDSSLTDDVAEADASNGVAVPLGTATESVRLEVGQRRGRTRAEVDDGVEV